MEKPEIFRYLDYRIFLRDYFNFLSSQNRKYSIRWLAQKAGLKSPHLISMILKGERKLSLENALLLANVFKFSPKEEEYLRILIELENAKNKEQQLEILDRIKFQFQNGFFKDLPDTGFEYIRKWFYPAVRELGVRKDLEVSAKSLAELLEISPDEAQEALDLLIRLNFLVPEGAGYRRADPSLKAADYASPLIMAQYHLQVLEKAFQAVNLTRDLRHFETLIVSLSSKDIETVREKIRQFVREIDMLSETTPRHDDVFQLSIQFFSLTGGRAAKAAK